MKILLAADGSPCTEAAARHIVTHLHWFADRPEVHVVHVSTPIPPRVVAGLATVAGSSVLDRYHHEEGEAGLDVASTVLREAGVPCKCSWVMGGLAAQLDAYVRAHGIDLVVMGSHGYGSAAGLVMGSATTHCLAKLEVPILVIRRAEHEAAQSGSEASG